MLDVPSAGAWNMSVDQALLESVEATGIPVIRIYRWAPATLSLGYFQILDDRNQHTGSLTCPVVRRASGGGAILHDQETTYSLCFPSSNRWSKRNTEIYTLVHDCITESLNDWEIEVTAYNSEVSKQTETVSSSFMCFSRRADGDLILDGNKVVGSAQRRSKNALLQHGSVLWERSSFATELPGIEDLAEHSVDTEQIAESFVTRLSKKLDLSMQREELTDAEHEKSRKIMATKFGLESWTRNRNRSQT